MWRIRYSISVCFLIKNIQYDYIGSYISCYRLIYARESWIEAIYSSCGYTTIYNVGRALSQALVILVIEFSVPPAIVSKAIVGIANFGNLHMKWDLIYSIDSAFHFFIIFL